MRPAKTTALFAVALLITESVSAAAFTLEKVLDTDTPVPGLGGTFTSVDEPPALSAGTVLVPMRQDPGGFLGIYTASVGGAPVEVSRRGGPMPDGAGVVHSFGIHSFDISGGNVLITPRRDVSSARTIFATTGGTPQVVVEHGVTPIPDGSGNFFNNLADSDRIPLSGENLVFEDTGTPNGIYARIGGSLQTVAQEGDASPNGSTYNFGFDEPDIDGANTVFEARTNAAATQGVFGVVGGTAITVASTDDTVPGQVDTSRSSTTRRSAGPASSSTPTAPARGRASIECPSSRPSGASPP